MKYLFHLGHPAHFHLFKYVIKQLKNNGHDVAILIKKKDVLEDLLKESGFEYVNILPHGRKDNRFGIALGMVQTDIKLFRFCLKYKPNLMVGTSYAISHVGKLLCIPSINVNEDDAMAVPLYAKLSYPWASEIITPDICDNGKWNSKSIKYHGYHELAYLHPNHFTPDKNIVAKYFSPDEPYFIIRFAKLKAHHDTDVKGIDSAVTKRIIEILKPHGRIYITSERELEEEFEQYRMAIKPLDMHHIMAFAQLYIGDSQTMAAEAGVLGTPFIRFNDFVGRIGYLNDLENNYHLGYGIKPNDPEKLFQTIKELVSKDNLKANFSSLCHKMISEKIDVALFLVWFIESYPKSVETMRANPEFQYNFK